MTTEQLKPCPFCGTAPNQGERQGIWCNNDACAIVGLVFSGGAHHWNRRTPVQLSAQTAVKTEQPSLSDAEIIKIAETLPCRPDQDRPSWGLGYRHDEAGEWRIPYVPSNLIPFARALLASINKSGINPKSFEPNEKEVDAAIAAYDAAWNPANRGRDNKAEAILAAHAVLVSAQRQDSDVDAERYRLIRSISQMSVKQQNAIAEAMNILPDDESKPTIEQFDAVVDAGIAYIANGAPK